MSLTVIFQLIIVVILAIIPALIWLRIWRGKNLEKKEKKFVFLSFGLGALSVFPVLFISYIWDTFPQTDILNIISKASLVQEEKILILFIIIAVLEEIAKFLVLLFVDKTTNLVNTIHDAIKYSIVAALGFAFAENIYYFYAVGLNIELIQFMALFAFRSIITVCGHLIFSGIFGNFYGMSKFAESFATQEYWGDMRKLDKRELSKQELVKKAKQFKRNAILKGLFFAVLLHATFNLFLELDAINYVLILIFISFLFLVYLYKRKSGYLTLFFRESKFAGMLPRDQDVVLELLGMWYNEGKYDEVVGICKRLLEKDPNNPLVKLFLNKAKDNKRFIDAYTAIKTLFTDSQEEEKKDITEEIEQKLAEQKPEDTDKKKP